MDVSFLTHGVCMFLFCIVISFSSVKSVINLTKSNYKEGKGYVISRSILNQQQEEYNVI